MAANWTDFVSGNVLTAAQLNGVLDNFSDIAIFNETQASNTAGGTSTANAWTKKVLNTTVANTITGCSIASSVITLTAGTYIVQANAPFYKSDEVKLKLRNTTDSTDTVLGISGYSGSGDNVNYITNLTGYFTITGSKNFELQYYLKTASATYGLGIAFNVASISEIYATLQLTQVA